jgi:large subunit ribosomal protein L25
LEQKLKARRRSETGKGAVKRLRNHGEIPAVMYGHGTEPQSLAVKNEELQDAIRGEAGLNVLLDLQVIDGKQKDNHLVMIKELQKHPFKEKLLHVDFLKVARDEKVTMKVPISILGEEESVGLRAGGTLQHNLWEVEVECLPTDVPDHLLADITEIAVGEHLSVADLKPRPGVTVLSDPEDIILTILAPRLLAELEEVPLEEEEEEAAKEEAAAGEAPPAESAPSAGGEET